LLIGALRVLPNVTDLLLQGESRTFFSVRVAVFNYMPIEMQPKDKWSRSKCCTVEGEQRPCKCLDFHKPSYSLCSAVPEHQKKESIKSSLKIL